MLERNKWGETVDECARRFLKDARTDEIDVNDRHAYAQQRAIECMRIFDKPDEQELREFYSRVDAYLSNG